MNSRLSLSLTYLLFRILILQLGLLPVFCQAPPRGSGPVDLPGNLRVVEADTFEAHVAGRQIGIGLIGVKAPMGNTPCGQAAIAIVQALLKKGIHLDEDLTLTFDDRQRRMYYGLINGSSLALQMVQAGLARADGNGKEAGLLRASEAAARSAGAGCLNGGPDNPPGPPSPGPKAKSVAPRTALPAGFTQDVIAAGLTNPTAMAFLPDGRVLIAEKHGIVKVLKNGSVLSTPFIDISTRVNDYWDHGLLGIAADPDFATNNNVYLLYTYEDNPAQYNGTKTARLTRVTAVGDTASPFSETVLLGTVTGASCNLFPAGSDCLSSDGVTHSIGSVRFAPDGTLFMTIGDGANFNTVDNNAYRAQNLDLLTGKVLHITNTGQGLATNPFYNGDVNANRSKVYAYGLRNPFRMQLRPGGATPFLGDVGWDTWEEVNAGPPGANYGWPCYEGNFQQSGYAPAAVCQSLYQQGSSAVTFGVTAWNHNGASAASIGGTFYTGTLYPAQYQGAYFYADYGQNLIRYLIVDSGNRLSGGPTGFATSADGPVDIEMAPEGNLWYLAINTGELRRIRFTSGNAPPTAVASGTPTNGSAPLTVNFSSAGSSDPTNDTLTYSWNFGDNTPLSTAANPQHTYTANGRYTAALTVNDGHGNTASATVVITAGNHAPVPTIASPAPAQLWKVGDAITFAGSATDAEDGNIPASGLSWQIILHHCPGGVCHIHPFQSATGSGGSFTAPDHGDESYFEIALTATDSTGLQATTSVNINPQTVHITLNTSPAGLQVVYGGQAGSAPFTQTTIVGSTHTLFAPSPQSSLGVTNTFTGWSDGGAQQHNVTLGATDVTYTATFATGFSPIRINCGGPNFTDPQGQIWIADTGFSAGTSFSTGAAISNTTTPALYQTEHYNSGTFQYQFSVPNGSYSVNLKFAEIFFTQSGRRKFNVLLNGQQVLSNFDVFAAAGGINIAVDRAFPVTVNNGQITIQFVAVVDNPKINAIEIVTNSGIAVAVAPTSATLAPSGTQQFSATVSGSANQAVTWSISPAFGAISSSGLYMAPGTVAATQNVSVIATSVADPTRSASATVTLTPPGGFTPIRVNAGGPSYTDSNTNIWSADFGYSSGTWFSTGNAISGTPDPTLYQTEHNDSAAFQYQFTVPNGNYNVTLKFAEIFFTASGQRLFNVLINGQQVLSNFDIVAQAGGAFRALDRTFPVTVASTSMTIQFVPIRDNPKISAIEIVSSNAVAVTVSPKTVSLTASQTQQFNASVTGSSNTAVTWSISPNTGSISSAGLYTAPSSIPSTQTVTVTATSAADPTKSDTATVTLSPSSITVAVSPKTASLTASQQQQFGATVTGTPNTAVTWSISPNTGSISASGLYTAPSSISSTQTVTVTATSAADNTRFDTAAVTLNPTSTFTPIRVNAGGPAFSDGAGNAWSADTGFSGGSTFTTGAAIAGTNDDTLYQSERWNSGTLQYQFAAPAGTYDVTLKFAEIFFTASGRRVFNIVINGQTVASNFDIFAQAGGANTAVDRAYTVSASTGQITIQLVGVVENPKISAIQIVSSNGVNVTVTPPGVTLGQSQTQQFSATVTGATNTAVTWSLSPALGRISGTGLYTAPATITSSQTVTVTATSAADPSRSGTATVTLTPPAQPATVRVNAGGPAYTDTLGNAWSADTGFTGGSTYATGAAIAGTSDPALYQTERWNAGTLTYNFAVPNATYTVTLKFAEIFFTSAGQRVFNIVINGATVASNFDIFAQAGGANRAVDRPFTVTVTGGQINIQLVPVVQNPKISAIQIQ